MAGVDRMRGMGAVGSGWGGGPHWTGQGLACPFELLTREVNHFLRSQSWLVAEQLCIASSEPFCP